MSEELSEGWISAELGKIVEPPQPGFACGKKDVDGGFPHLRMNNIGVEGDMVLDLVRRVPNQLVRPQHRLEQGDVLICTTNSGKLVGKTTLYNLPIAHAFSNHLTRLRPEGGIDSSFLRWALWLAWRSGDFEDKCKHWVNQSTLPKEELVQIPIPLAPLAEQKRIVEKLDAVLGKVDACRQRLERIPTILKRFRQSVLAAACSGKLTADWREENSCADAWDSTTVGEVADYVGGYAYKSKTFEKSGNNQVIRIGNVKPFELSLETSPVFIPQDIANETKRFKIEPQDILVSMTGTKYKRDYGYAALVGNTEQALYLNQRVARLRLSASVIPHFLLFFLQTDLFRDFLFSEETGNVNQGNVGAAAIKAAPIELPSILEQQEIVRRVNALFALADTLEARYQNAKTHVDKLTQSVLAKAFRGDLVPTEAELAREEGRDYEPASVLLERIQAEREARPKTARKRAAKKNSRKRAT